MTPLVSVLVLAYNHGPYLADALDSVLKQQTPFEFEILVGEDCSLDDSLKIAERYVKLRPDKVRLVTSDRNVGMQSNLRRLVMASTGSYIAFCEGDDYWNPCDRLARQVGRLEAEPQFGAVHSDFDHIAVHNGQWKALRQFWRHHGIAIPVGDVFDTLVRQNFVQLCTLVARASLVRDYFESGLPTSRYLVGDWPLSLYISCRSYIGYMDESLATYRLVPGSATNQGHEAEMARARDHIRMASDLCRHKDASLEVEFAAHEAAMRTILERSVRVGDTAGASEAWGWLERHDRAAISRINRLVMRLLVRRQIGLRALNMQRPQSLSMAEDAYSAPPHDPRRCT